MHADTDREALYLRPSTSVYFGEELFKCGTTADGGLESEWRSERWGGDGGVERQ